LAELALQKKYTRPTLFDDNRFVIEKGRHPVVENALKNYDNSDFIANDCTLSMGGQLWLLTGPNMAGKSTFLRQNALIALLAQMGSFVPASRAEIGMIDQIFSRVGAADDLARGRSTFMVEMVETAAILNQASDKSLVILDEIGRGTATFDGLSIAWATLEYLHDQLKCRGIFATHYHELTSLTKQLNHLKCYAMRVREWEDKIIFMHEVVAGAADRSYGIHVAKIAGLPDVVVARAEQVLNTLEAERTEIKFQKTKPLEALPLFSDLMKEAKAPKPLSEAEKILQDIDVDSLSPKDALALLYRLKEKIM
jgi:DNA mismatch repair protein MutS